LRRVNPSNLTRKPRTYSTTRPAKRTPGSWLDTRRPYEGRRWAAPGARELFEGNATFFAKPDVYPLDDHGLGFSYAYFSPKHLGAGQFYLITIKDKEGRSLDGRNTYRNITAKRGADGAVAIQFGGGDGKIPNCLPIIKGWNYTMVRQYRPRTEILSGKWKFPEARPKRRQGLSSLRDLEVANQGRPDGRLGIV
jgi:hypothetical protein